MVSLTNNTAPVTEASRGIGRSTAQALAPAWAHVIVPHAPEAGGRSETAPSQELVRTLVDS
jgi:NAD(P)-dependent dehydrogenase (short-subunit alcohol dehydrogenase family)